MMHTNKHAAHSLFPIIAETLAIIVTNTRTKEDANVYVEAEQFERLLTMFAASYDQGGANNKTTDYDSRPRFVQAVFKFLVAAFEITKVQDYSFNGNCA
eukprot:2536472-Rhodomonas_salina.1